MKSLKIAHVLAAILLLAMLSAPARAEVHQAKLIGFQEVPVVVTEGSGHFKMKIAPGGESFKFELSYEGLEGTPVLQAHIHVGQKSVNGGIVIFLCTNLAPPAGVPVPPACPEPSGTVEGERTAADVIAVATQSVSAADFAAVLKAIRNGKAYANVHTTVSPGGEIRGQIK